MGGSTTLTTGSQRSDGKQVIGNAMGQFAQRVGGARSYHQQVGAVTQPDMQDMRLSTHKSASVKALQPVTDWKVSGVMNFSAAGSG